MKAIVSKIREKSAAVGRKLKSKALAALAVVGVAAAALNIGTTQTFAAATPAPVDFSGQSLDVNVAGAVSSAFSFLGMFGTWVYLVLGIMLAPVMIAFVFWIIGKLRRNTAKA